ncbi:cell division protein ZapE [Arenicella xantha]|uniref:Cell division protein ZapE n=1 Tax=Arenicella xantha TaxID=644221 RepID=A0A395JP73_9GAMM|nr:cell division protein ZapE [Arenicella xantha]
MVDTPLSRYQRDLQNPDFLPDQTQQLAVEHLQRLYDELVTRSTSRRNWRSRIGLSKSTVRPVQGLYFWGGVGRGKTYLVDTFFDCLPFEQKLRMHFHRFMHRIHQERKALREQQDPLVVIGKQIAKEARVLCFDEFVVNDVADAVILVKLMRVLFDEGVTLVATSNVEPDNLYLGGLQRDLFLPAIAMIHEYTEIVNIDSGIDYRLRFLDKAETYFTPINQQAHAGMEHNFVHLAPDAGVSGASIEIEGRMLQAVRRADGVIWFTFATLCDGPRSQNDYIELARCFHSILLSDVSVMSRLHEDQARRFINMVDVFYDHNVKLIISAHAPVDELYQGTRVKFEFERTKSRLQEMQSHDYLALSHKV